MPETKPGSRAHQLVQLVEDLVDERGRGVEVDEIRDAYETQTGQDAPDSLTSEISSLKRRDLLQVVGGRPGHSLYAPANVEMDYHHREDDPVFRVLEALRAGFERRGRPLPTREVQAELERRGDELDSDNPDAVRRHLHTLARERVRGPEEFRDPQVVRFTATTTAGFGVNYWAPAGADLPEDPPLPPRSTAEAIRRAVDQATEDHPRPVSRTELLWWLDGHQDRPLQERINRDRLGTALADTRSADEGHQGEEGRLHVVTTPFTCHGGPDVRYTIGPAGEHGTRLCHLEDVCVALRLEEELRTLRGLETQIQMGVQPEPFDQLATARRGTAVRLLHEAADDEDPAELIVEAKGGLGRRIGWVTSAGLTHDQLHGRKRALRNRVRQLKAAERLLRFMEPDQAVEVDRVGEAGTVSLSELEPLLQSAADLLELPEGRAQGLVERARRVPSGDDPGGERFGAAAEAPLSLLDRIDAVTLVFRAFSVPRANVLVDQARAVLGHAVRDVELLKEILEELPDREREARRTVWIALALLGELVSPDEARLDPGSFEDVTAWTLSAVLADWEGAVERIDRMDRQVEGPARSVTDMALARVESGMLVSAVG